MKDNIFFRIALFIITAYFFFSGLFYLRELLVPILFGALLAMLVLPLCKRMERKLSRGLAVVICLFIIMGVIFGLMFLLYSQIALLAEDFPLFKEKAIERLQTIQGFIEKTFKVSAAKQSALIQSNSAKLLNFGGTFITSLLVGLTGGLAVFLIVVLYIFFFLILRTRIKNFILQLFKLEQHKKVRDIINKITGLTLHYMMGLLLEILALGTLNSIGFLILGIRQAIFFGFLGAVLNLIPYVGALIGAIFPMFIALVYKDSLLYPLGVIIVIVITQFIDNNFLTPKIVGSHIKINALATIIVILVGGMLWGLPGMILFLPLLGMLKIVADNIEPLNPLGYLIGEDEKEANPKLKVKD